MWGAPRAAPPHGTRGWGSKRSLRSGKYPHMPARRQRKGLPGSITITITICYRLLASRTDIGLQHPSTTFLSRGRLLKAHTNATLHPKHRLNTDLRKRARRTANTTQRQDIIPRRTPLTGPAEPTQTHDAQNPRQSVHASSPLAFWPPHGSIDVPAMEPS